MSGLVGKISVVKAGMAAMPCTRRRIWVDRKAGRVRASDNGERDQGAVVPKPSYNLALGLIGTGAVAYGLDNKVLCGFLGSLGLLLVFQATSLRYKFYDKFFEITKGDQESENIIAGGANNWEYKTIVNWEMWWPAFPILVYFKEIQTKPEGQIHFFPVTFDGKQLYDVMVEKVGPNFRSKQK